jgi:hypothetical protein
VTVNLAMKECLPPHRVGLATVALIGVVLGLAACGTATSDPPPAAAPSRTPSSTASRTANAAARGCPSPAAAARARAVLRGAKRRFQIESRGSVIHADLRYIAHDSVLLEALRSGDLAAARAEVARLQHSQIVKHVTRIRLLRGSRVLVDGWPASFDMAGSERALRDRNGRSLGRVQITIQDVIGFIKLEHKHDATEVVVRGAQGRVRTLLPAARGVSLPASGCVRVGAHRYMVRSFHETGFIGEPLTFWLLTRA